MHVEVILTMLTYIKLLVKCILKENCNNGTKITKFWQTHSDSYGHN